MYPKAREKSARAEDSCRKRAVGDGGGGGYASAAAVISVGRRSFDVWGLWPVGHLLAATFGILSI